MWSIIKELVQNHRTKLEVKCDCGNISIVRKDHLLSGRTKECKQCSAKRTASNYPLPIRFTGIGNLSGTFWNQIRAGAKRRDIKFNITIDYAWKLYNKQKGKCALSGIPITLSKNIINNTCDWHNTTASLDRINSKLGYEEGNVQWVHKRVNYIKRDLDESEFIEWCKLISKEQSCGS